MKKKFTMKEFRSLIKEEATKLHRRGLLENEKKNLMEEFGMMEDQGNSVMNAYDLADNAVSNMDLPDEIISNEKMYFEFVSALNDKLTEQGADLFANNAGAAPDEFDNMMGNPMDNMGF